MEENSEDSTASVYSYWIFTAQLKNLRSWGGEHQFTEDGKKYDQKRTEYLNEHGIRVIRFENHEGLEEIEKVFDGIRNEFGGGSYQPPSS